MRFNIPVEHYLRQILESGVAAEILVSLIHLIADCNGIIFCSQIAVCEGQGAAAFGLVLFQFGLGRRRLSESIAIAHEPSQPFQSPHEDAIAFYGQLFAQTGIALVSWYRVAEANQDQPAEEAFRTVAIVAWNVVAGEQEPGIWPERAGVLVLALCGDVIFAG